MFGLLVLLLFTSTEAAVNCSSASTCSECISLPYSCFWCYTPGLARCLSPQDNDSCSTNISSYSSAINEINESPISDQNQVSLKSVSLKLRVNESIDVKVSVKASSDYPLDLYILMDLSSSFEIDLDNVKNIAPQLPLSLQNVSSSFKIGFGAFVDKPILPFTSNQQLMYEPVPGRTIPFGYEHIVSLTNSSDLFNSVVQDIRISTNVDNPEGTLDAMLQAVVCDDVIEWREDSRKILLVMTDDVLHTAGDGSLAGIVKPNDGLCHTEYDESTNRTLYTASLLQDYPSMELVKMALTNNDIVPVFAVATVAGTSDIFTLYNESVSPFLNGFAVALDDDSSNLISVLIEAYRRVVANAQLSFNVPDHISATVRANCSNYLPQRRECVEIGNETVEFTMSVSLRECTQELRDNKSTDIIVTIPGFSQFVIKVSGHCSCECESESTRGSTECSNNGNLTCGLCNCDEGWEGSTCSCSTRQCPVGLNGITCNGRGTCECGECHCNNVNSTELSDTTGVDNPLIYGSACECSNYECLTDGNGLVCSGEGDCLCYNGTYECLCAVSVLTGERRTGEWCQCSTDHCINPDASNQTLVCSGNGTCNPCEPKGQACTCNDLYSGPYCEESTIISGTLLGTCDDSVRGCVICYGEAARSGSGNSSIRSFCGSRSCNNFVLLTSSPSDEYIIPGSQPNSNTDCSFISGECQYTYIAARGPDGEDLYAVPPRICLPIPIWAIATILLVLIILLGIGILIAIKCCCMYLDYKEYNSFKAEVSKAAFEKMENPMYHTPDVTYKNIAYGAE